HESFVAFHRERRQNIENDGTRELYKDNVLKGKEERVVFAVSTCCLFWRDCWAVLSALLPYIIMYSLPIHTKSNNFFFHLFGGFVKKQYLCTRNSEELQKESLEDIIYWICIKVRKQLFDSMRK
ncbi:MAG: hypothetical protein II050_00550, partial [Bacteroidaceae bacterium]|nr:hypothetical protein [Bacteroidaceae bacterium]